MVSFLLHGGLPLLLGLLQLQMVSLLVCFTWLQCLRVVFAIFIGNSKLTGPLLFLALSGKLMQESHLLIEEFIPSAKFQGLAECDQCFEG